MSFNTPRHTRPLAASVAASLLLMCVAMPVRAATPDLRVVTPRGAQRGTEIDAVFEGVRLNDAAEILFYSPGITVTKLEAASPTQVKAHLKIEPDASIGEHQLRVRTATGLSELRTFYVGPFPIVAEKEPNNDFFKPQPIDMNVTVAGTIENEDVDYFVVDCKKGQRLTAEVHGARLATTNQLFDPYVAILDQKRFELSASDDTALAIQDPIASTIIPADGKYVIMVRETSYGGGGGSMYLLHVGTYPRPMAVYPSGGKAGEDVAVQYIGDVLGPIPQTIKLPPAPTAAMPLICEQNGQLAPSPNLFRVSPFANVLEVEPNDTVATATRYDGELPIAFNGIINKPNDIDFFRFKAHQGQALDVRVVARALRSPLDSVLVVYNAQGGGMASNDDSGGPDSYVRFTAPAEGEYVVSVTDHLHDGGAAYVYRVEITPAKPALTLVIPEVNVNSQERQTIVIPRGGRFATLMRGTRADFGGEIAFACADLPQGVTVQAENVSASTDVAPLVFTAAPDAPLGQKLCELTAKSVDPKVDVLGHYDQPADLVIGPNNQPLYAPHVYKLAVAVVNEAPYTLKVIQPKVPLVQGGSMNLKVVAERKGDFKGPISVRMVFTPPGVTSSPSVDIPADKTEVLYPLNAAEGAESHKWKICVLGSAESAGLVWLASEPIQLEVAPSLVAMKLEMTAAERGKPAQVYCTVEQKTKFDGQATVKLIGLPNFTTAADVPLTAADQKLIFNVETNDKSPIGQHATLFCQLTLMKDGEPIVQDTGRGGVLRIDPPPPPKAQPAAQAVAPPPPPPKPAEASAKPLSRLEKLRLEQQGK